MQNISVFIFTSLSVRRCENELTFRSIIFHPHNSQFANYPWNSVKFRQLRANTNIFVYACELVDVYAHGLSKLAKNSIPNFYFVSLKLCFCIGVTSINRRKRKNLIGTV